MPTVFEFSPMRRALGRRLRAAGEEASSLEEEHSLIADACAQLEAIADALPKAPARLAVEGLAANLRDAIPAHCRHEEGLLRSLAGVEGPLAAAFALLEAEHEANEAVALELADALERYLDPGERGSPDALGQLIRQFFTMMQRHMAWEEFTLAFLLADIPVSRATPRPGRRDQEP